MKILVTGGCGFIGSHLCEYYLNLDHEVFAVDNLSSGRLANIESFQKNPKFIFEMADLLTWENIDQAISWADVIFHFAASVGMFNVVHDPVSVLINNVMGCQRVLETMHRVQSSAIAVIASSSSVYGDSPKGFLNENDNLIVHPLSYSISTYPISKLADEAMGYAYYNNYGTKLFFARMFNTIGPRQTGVYGMVVPRFVKQACTNAPITVFGDGHQTRSFCDVRDVVHALDMLINEPEALGKSINIGKDVEISINELAHMIKERAKSSSIIEHQSYEQVYGPNYLDITQRRPDLTLLRQLIPFTHQWDLQATIDDLIARELSLSS